MSARRYSADPHWLEARYAGTCARCGEAFGKGERIFYYPHGKRAYSGECAESCARDFSSARWDEEVNELFHVR